jgi:DMSO/TMAO reductase YedYZ molybdopterin-dependent catalytic subunit
MAAITRRHLLQRAGIAGLGAAAGLALPHGSGAAEKSFLIPGLPDGLYGVAELDSLPGKKPLIKLSYRPPNYETPLEYFGTTVTPNDAFFVRYHLSGIPESIDAKAWRLKIGGEAAATPLELGLDDLMRSFEPVEIAAVCQCSGNRRGLSDPHVPGVQWGVGAMGNAVWKGARFRDVLAKAGLRKDALEIVLAGADGPVLDKTPAFVKSIPVWKALDENTLIAYEMNGQPLPYFNGFPARLIVPGWTATYWMKHVTRAEAVTKPFEGFWMKSAYRIPTGKFPVIDRFISQETPANTPITEMVVNSLTTSPAEGATVSAGKPVEVAGIAWDAGYGVTRVDASTDGGKTWTEAELGEDRGRFSFRPWRFRFTPQTHGTASVLARASNRAGQTQTESLIFNPAGYHNNAIRPLHLAVA